MSDQHLSDYIDSIASKKLKEVEVNSKVSNQHELNGVSKLRAMLGSDPTEKYRFQTSFAYLTDEEADCFTQSGSMTWYNSRIDKPDRGPEFRLYYDKNVDFSAAKPGDSFYIVKKKDGSFLSIICENGSTIESQVNWLFDVKDAKERFDVKEIAQGGTLPYAAKTVLNLIGIETEPDTDSDIEELLAKYTDFPSSAEFSAYARSFVDVDPVNHPDDALVAWLDKEDTFFKALEQHMILSVIDELADGRKKGMPDNELTERYISTSLSIQNRRKSRAGNSFEHHIKALFDQNHVKYTWHPKTENNNVPDFILPSIELYRDPSYDADLLTMLAAKTTCKDRWRQIVEEADRIKTKHLATIQTAISEQQIEQMFTKNVQLVIPEEIRQSQPERFIPEIWNMERFIGFAMERQ